MDFSIIEYYFVYGKCDINIFTFKKYINQVKNCI